MKCKKNLATVKLTRIVNGKVTEISLCKQCASEVSPYQKKLNEAQSSLSEILQKLLSGAEVSAEPAKPEQNTPAKQIINVSCSRCGLAFDSYQSTLLLGCPKCYDSFEKYLVPDLRRLHGSTRHEGKVPERFKERFDSLRHIKELESELETAIDREDFEKAIMLRDKIRKMKGMTDTE
jgi:protein arginine kinase activator